MDDDLANRGLTSTAELKSLAADCLPDEASIACVWRNEVVPRRANADDGTNETNSLSYETWLSSLGDP